MHDLYSLCQKEGLRARKLPPDRQALVEANVRDRLEAAQEQEMKKWNIRGSFLTKARDEAIAKLNEVSEGISVAVHRQSLLHGVFFLSFVLLLLIGEFLIMTWTLSPFSLAFEGLLIASCITITGMLAVDKYLSQVQKVKPELYQKYILYMVVISLVLLISTGMLLAHTRGVLMGSQNTGSDLERQIDEAKSFYKRTSYFPFVMGFAGVALSLIMGVVLHEALPRVIVSGNVLALDRKARKADQNILAAGLRLQEAEAIVRTGMCEFRTALSMPEDKKEGFWLSPIVILILAFLLILVLAAVVRGEEREAVFILLDLSKSELSEDYSGKSDFQKNLSAAAEIIRDLNPGTDLKVIGITGDSLGRPFVVMEGTLPGEKGAFGEKLAKAKLSLVEKWEKADLKATADETDIFGALGYVSMLFGGKSGVKKLIILSDMRNTVGFDLEKPVCIEEGLLEKMDKNELIPDLDGVKVWALGVSSNGKTMKYMKSLRAFWERFFLRANAELVSFSPEREWR
jgi:hypothetical protein